MLGLGKPSSSSNASPTTPEEIKPSANAIMAQNSPYFMKKKILCQVWSNDGGIDKIIASRKVSYGSTDFTINTGRKTRRRFQIQYDPKIGALKQGKKFFIYDTYFDNSLGSCSFHEYKEKVDSKQAETMLQDGAVDFFIAKGGIPMIYLLFAIIGMAICGGALGLIAPQYIQVYQLEQAQEKQITQLSQTIFNLQHPQTTTQGGVVIGH